MNKCQRITRLPLNSKYSKQRRHRRATQTTHTHTYTHIHTVRPQHLQRYNFTGPNYSGLQRRLFGLPTSRIAHTRIAFTDAHAHVDLNCTCMEVGTTRQCEAFFSLCLPADDSHAVFLSNAVFTQHTEALHRTAFTA